VSESPGTPETADVARRGLRATVGSIVRAIQDDDEAAIEAILRVGRSRRLFAPLVFAIGAFAMLLGGVRLLLTNWRLTLVQVLPAVWIWLAMFDLRAHVLHGKSFHTLRGPILIPINLAIVAVTVAAYFLNAVFAYAISRPPPPEVRPAIGDARRDAKPIAAAGAIVGLLLGFSVTVTTRWGGHWFALSLGAVVGLMMVTYVAVPARLLGIKTTHSKRDKLVASAVGSAVSTTVSLPPYLLARLGILMLGSSALLIPGIIVLTVGVTLQAGATGAVRAVKMSAKLT
jgi:hypothetical protein